MEFHLAAQAWRTLPQLCGTQVSKVDISYLANLQNNEALTYYLCTNVGYRSFDFVGYSNTWTKVNGQKADPDCPLNTLSEPPNANDPLANIFEEYAANQAAWILDFADVLEKMLSNGYRSDELVDAPNHVSGVVCHQDSRVLGRFWSCYHHNATLNPPESSEHYLFVQLYILVRSISIYPSF